MLDECEREQTIPEISLSLPWHVNSRCGLTDCCCCCCGPWTMDLFELLLFVNGESPKPTMPNGSHLSIWSQCRRQPTLHVKLFLSSFFLSIVSSVCCCCCCCCCVVCVLQSEAMEMMFSKNQSCKKSDRQQMRAGTARQPDH